MTALRSIVPVVSNPGHQMLLISFALQLELARFPQVQPRPRTRDEELWHKRVPPTLKALVDQFVKNLIEQCFADAQQILDLKKGGQNKDSLKFGGVVCLVPVEDLYWVDHSEEPVFGDSHWYPRSNTTSDDLKKAFE